MIPPVPDCAHIASQSERPRHVLSVDVEDYFQVEAFAGSVKRDDWDAFPSRVAANTQKLLELFARHQAHATFFFLGWVAERFPALVREVQAAGHEVACHSYWHRRVDTLSRDEFRADTARAVDVIAQACGTRVRGYRAPTWSITRRSLWALEILAELGFQYDSSIFPIRHDLYGIPDAPRNAHTVTLSGTTSIHEYPPTTVRLLGHNFPAAGGGYLRIFPLSYNRWALENWSRRGESAVVYLHPWEVDPEQPRIAAGWRSQFRHYRNLRRTEERLTALLQQFSFQSFAQNASIAVKATVN